MAIHGPLISSGEASIHPNSNNLKISNANDATCPLSCLAPTPLPFPDADKYNTDSMRYTAVGELTTHD
jgi:hypothetical protein